MKYSSICVALYMILFTSAEVMAQEAQRPGVERFTVGETWEWTERRVADAEPNKALMESFDIRTVVLIDGEKKFVKKFSGGSK